jgi:hypothetical protein
MDIRATLESSQLPIASFGALVCLGAIASVWSMPPAEGDGFVTGLATLVLYVVAWIGFIVTCLGLAIPVSDGLGIQFNPWQRRLFLAAAVFGVLGVVSPLVFWPVVATTALSLDAVAMAWVGVMGLAVLSMVGGLGWRAVEAVTARARERLA